LIDTVDRIAIRSRIRPVCIQSGVVGEPLPSPTAIWMRLIGVPLASARAMATRPYWV